MKKIQTISSGIQRIITDGATTSNISGATSGCGWAKPANTPNTLGAEHSIMYYHVDAPAQAANTTINYKVQVKNNNNSSSIVVGHDYMKCTVTLMEIAV